MILIKLFAFCQLIIYIIVNINLIKCNSFHYPISFESLTILWYRECVRENRGKGSGGRGNAIKSYVGLKRTKSKELERALLEKLYPELKQKKSVSGKRI